MRHVAAAVLAAACCVVGVGCSSDSAADKVPRTTMSPAPSTTTSPSSPTTSAPTTSEGPTPPQMPAVAKKKTAAGAKAFVKYYIQTLNRSWKVGTGQPLRTLSSPECGGCRSLAKVIDKFNRAGGYQHGAAWHPKSIMLVPTQPADEPIAQVVVKVDKGSWRASASDRTHVIKSTLNHEDFYLTWANAHWRVRDVVPR